MRVFRSRIEPEPRSPRARIPLSSLKMSWGPGKGAPFRVREPFDRTIINHVARVIVFTGSGRAVPNHQVGLHFVGVVPEILHRLSEFVERSQATVTA